MSDTPRTDLYGFDLLEAALDYRNLWLICHENTPRPPKTGEIGELGRLRGRLFATIDLTLADKDESWKSAPDGGPK